MNQSIIIITKHCHNPVVESIRHLFYVI